MNDAASALISNQPPHMMVLEIKQCLPCDESLWNAPSAEEWHKEYAMRESVPENQFIEVLHSLLNFYHAPRELNELSAMILGGAVLLHIRELGIWKGIHGASRTSGHVGPAEAYGHLASYGPEIHARENQLRFALDVLSDRARQQRVVASTVSSSLWDDSVTIYQLGYLRLHLADPQNTHGIVSYSWRTAFKEMMLVIATEHLGSIDYVAVTATLTWFVDLISSKLTRQYSGAARGDISIYSCITVIKIHMDIWRMVRYSHIHMAELNRHPNLSAAKDAFMSAVARLSDLVMQFPRKENDIAEPDFAQVLSKINRDLYESTGMGSFLITADLFTFLESVAANNGRTDRSSKDIDLQQPYESLSICF